MRNPELNSVIVPVYNLEDYLPKCLETIINQSYHILEIILVNDGSTDRSGDIYDKYAKNDSRIIVVHQNNLGQVTARNTGKEMSNGKHIKLPKYMARGTYIVDLDLHQPTIQDFFRARNCASLYVDGSYDQFALPMNLSAEGFMGLESVSS